MIDAHAHLSDARFTRDVTDVLGRAKAAGVTRILAVGEDLVSSQDAVALARSYPVVRAAVGVHPHRAASLDDGEIRHLRELSKDERVVAIGEIGIDLSGRSAPRADQERAFTAQLELAGELGLPVSVHVRDSGALVRGIIDRLRGCRGYVHCYSEGPAEVREWIDRGFLVSFAGTVTYPRSDALRAAAASVPGEHLLVETDAPVLAPQAHRGQRNEPAFIAATYACIAELRHTTLDDLAKRVSENAASLFGPRW